METARQIVLLLVDDDANLRRSLKRFLGHDDFSVIEAVDGLNALEIAVQHGCRFDVVVTDLQMPRLGGIELAKRLKEVCPDLPVILMTGEDANKVVKRDPGLVVVRKPFNPDLLVSTIQEVLTSRSI